MEIVIILLVLLALSIIWIVLSVHNNWDDGKGASILFTVVFLFLFTAVSIEKDKTCEYEEVTVTITPTPNCIIVVDKYGYKLIKDYEITGHIDSTTIWYREHTTNFWGTKDIENVVPDFKLK